MRDSTITVLNVGYRWGIQIRLWVERMSSPREWPGHSPVTARGFVPRTTGHFLTDRFRFRM